MPGFRPLEAVATHPVPAAPPAGTGAERDLVPPGGRVRLSG
jgi:hypothetical protein